MALDTGFTMITLDCSEHINNEAAHLGKSEIENIYRDSISAEERGHWKRNMLTGNWGLKAESHSG